MKNLFLRFWNEDAMAERIIRALLMTVGSAMISGLIPGGNWGAILNGLAVTIPAGEINAKTTRITS